MEKFKIKFWYYSYRTFSFLRGVFAIVSERAREKWETETYNYWEARPLEKAAMEAELTKIAIEMLAETPIDKKSKV